MIYLILPDIHDKIRQAQSIIDSVPHDFRIFLGDFFDDFPTGPAEAVLTAAWVKVWLHDPSSVVLLGNHDMSYGWGWKNRRLICSGWTREKSDIIHTILQPDDWKLFKLAFWLEADNPNPKHCRPWLITHAGFHPQFVPVGTAREDRLLAIRDSISAATTALHGYRTHALLSAGWSRGGDQSYGGLVWCDWRDEFQALPGINQLVGHTLGAEPRVKKTKNGQSICLDTNLAHYALYDSKTRRMRVEAVKGPGFKRGTIL